MGVDPESHALMMPDPTQHSAGQKTVLLFETYELAFCQPIYCTGDLMRRPALYSPSESDRPGSAQLPQDKAIATPAPQTEPAAPSDAPRARWLRRYPARVLAGLLTLALLVCLGWIAQRPAAQAFTQKDIDAAVLHSLQTQAIPSAVARAADIMANSVVRVVSYGHEKGSRREQEIGIGTGVVIVDKGVILTSLHVVRGAERIGLVFFDGLESSASVTGTRPEQDLAVLQADRIPDDLAAATLRSSTDLQPGDAVATTGFPFGVGPSVSSGVVSGLNREFQSPEGRETLHNMIQFDAAANPGNSGGPLYNMQGEVVGIVTAILNPGQSRTFIGIGFAVPIESAASAAGMPPF
jgi:S1-C subfamily serine protease